MGSTKNPHWTKDQKWRVESKNWEGSSNCVDRCQCGSMGTLCILSYFKKDYVHNSLLVLTWSTPLFICFPMHKYPRGCLKLLHKPISSLRNGTQNPLWVTGCMKIADALYFVYALLGPLIIQTLSPVSLNKHLCKAVGSIQSKDATTPPPFLCSACPTLNFSPHFRLILSCFSRSLIGSIPSDLHLLRISPKCISATAKAINIVYRQEAPRPQGGIGLEEDR